MQSRMNLINLLLPCRQSPNTNEHKNLGTELITLPPELLQMITNYLSPADSASLVLCNHILFGVLGNKHLLALRSGKDQEEDRELFLTTLTRDLPGHFYCHYCSHLHLRDDLGPPGPALQPDNRLLCIKKPPELDLRYCFGAPQTIFHYRLAFSHLQLAMKRYRHGPGHGISTESLSFTEVHVSGHEDDAERVTTLLSVEARICPEPISLCLRIQQWALFSSKKRNTVLSETGYVIICDHMHTRSPKISRLIESKLEPGRTESECQVYPEVFRCPYCNTDFQIEVKESGDERLALVVTKWLDLGSGLTPMDIKWRVHRANHKTSEIGVMGKPGEVRLRFEVNLDCRRTPSVGKMRHT